MTAAPSELARFAGAVAAHLALRVESERSEELLERRAAANHEPVAAYLDRLDVADPEELAALVVELTVGETYFLRHIEQFRAFIEIAVPDRMKRGPVRVLSAGCSSGEEAYTLAMLLREAYPATAFAVHAVDLNPKSIARARAGRYSRWSLRAVPPAFEQRWFLPDGRDVVVVPEVRAAVTFDHANLLDHDELSRAARWDIVFCRNVMMYFTEDRADAMISRFARAIAPGGYLFLGHAETLRGRTDEFALCHTHGTFYYQRHPATTAAGISTAPASSHITGPIATMLDAAWFDDIHAAAQRVHAMVDGAMVPDVQRPVAVPAARPSPAAPAVARPAPTPAPDLEQVRGLLADERFGEALERLDDLRATAGADRDIAMLRALVLTHAGRFAEARVACAELLAIDSTSAGANYLLALCFDSTGDTDGAAHLAQLAADLDPSFAMPRVHLGLLARRVGDRAVAAKELTRAIGLLEREATTRLELYGGGFSRQALLAMCRAELAAIGALR
jgi:chemotaxis protein methyltransferase CheR